MAGNGGRGKHVIKINLRQAGCKRAKRGSQGEVAAIQLVAYFGALFLSLQRFVVISIVVVTVVVAVAASILLCNVPERCFVSAKCAINKRP